MPVSRDLATPLIEALVQIYIDAQAQLAITTANALRKGMDSPDWVSEKNNAARDLELTLRKILQKLGRQTSGRLADAVAKAYEMGGAAAAEEVASHMTAEGAARAAVQLPQSAAVQRLVLSQVSKLGGTHLPVLRSVMDAYREAVAAGGAGDVLTGVSTRREATQRAWSRLLDKGITSFTDARGRTQNLASYAEMAMRTTVAHAAVEGHLDKLADLDLDLVIVSNSSQECELCRPWEGKILSRSGGGARTVLAENPATGKMMTVEVAGSVDEAVRAGLLHPDCRHSLSAYFPGLTEVPTNTADPEGDAERQRLRALERRVRRLRTQEVGALDDKARDHYAKLADKARADIRDHVKASSSNLMRKPERELVNLGHKRTPAAVAARQKVLMSLRPK